MRFDLTRLPLVMPILRGRWPQLLVRLVALAGFIFAILAGLFGTPVGSRNFAIIFVWIAWWALLMLLAVPIFGRGWCSICPIPVPGEWLQNGALLAPQAGKPGSSRPQRQGLSLGWRWPRALRNIWIQNGAFTLVALFSTVILTQPRLTSAILLLFLLVALAASLLYERRSFCRYLCPVGGFIGLYSQLAPLELRVKDTAICASHTEKTCYTGNASGYGCPWQVFPGGLIKNTYCGLCMECLRTCPHENLALNLRSPGADLVQPSGRKLDESFKAFIMLGSACVYSATLLGPWGWLKATAYNLGSAGWFVYALSFLLLVFGILPGTFLLAVRAGRRFSLSAAPLRKSFIAFSYCLVPLGLSAWIAFSLSFVFTNLSYLWPALSDPFGWGWNLLGAAGVAWTPYFTNILPSLQVFVLLGGLFWASLTARRIAGESSPGRLAPLQALPVVVYCLSVSLGLMFLLVG